MIVPEKMSLSDFVSRRLHPVKVTISLMRHELAHNSKGDNTEMSRHLLSSAISTLETAYEAALIEEENQVEDAKPSLLGG